MKLRLMLRSEQGALQRVLVHAGRRGFDTLAMTARPAPDGMSVEMELRGPRDATLLARTLERLYDVASVEIITEEETRP